MDLGLDGRKALVTGGVSGIGQACAQALEAEGARVAVLDRAPGTRFRADVTDSDSLAAAVGAAVEWLGGLDIVVGCAGISGPVGNLLVDTSAEEIAGVLAVNVLGQLLLAKHVYPHMGYDGSIVLLGSDSAFVSVPGMVPYSASKGAVVSMTRALAVEFSPVRVNCVCPSIVDTPMARGDLGDRAIDEAEFPVQAAGDVANQVLYLASERSRTVNGQAILTDFGYSARSGFPA
ncbi:SDR family NAD(P)-dependent oxidoreductase [Actinokineospora cianjurensis]|uniref:Dihydroanticapsin dehydrogenase n=1 Tax=Actinokineospora cianjurensis TaxID=585224 RepID=A0A421BBL8_9PSEU|nr:SDR family oxidoreductase [Actinokineospora cianjurensis]RLK61764.1 dihydroanticapsin dehydrogenase [Actinokineospora cianjurensis]